MEATVRIVRPLRQGFHSLQTAQAYVERVRKGSGQYHNAQLEIHYNPRKVINGAWNVVAIDDNPPPGGKPCVECKRRFHSYADYLCPACREQAQL